MCIVLLSTAHPQYPFILLSNRDEFLHRPTASADWWEPPNEHVLGGRDLQREERGTWLAVTKQGRIVALTNFRGDGDQNKNMEKSRGGIVNAYVTSSPGKRESPQDFANRLIEEVGVDDVGGFSMLFGELRAPDSKDGTYPGLSILSNRSAAADSLTTIATKPGETHGLSNSHFGDTSWPKVVLGEHLLGHAIENHAIENDIRDGRSNETSLLKTLFSILSVDKLPARKQGEDWDTYVLQMRNSILIPPVGGPSVVNGTSADTLASAQSRGYDTLGNDHGNVKVGVEAEAGGYGTQKQTIILVDRNGRVKFVERTLYDRAGGRIDEDRVFEFEIEGWKDAS